MGLHIDLLIPTQKEVRNCAQIDAMKVFVENGGVFDRKSLDQFAEVRGTKASPLIQITEFEDGQTYIHDGHHRLIAIYRAGREWLRYDEYEIKSWKYGDYQEINLDEGWMTPFDPRNEVRKADLAEWKRIVADNRILVGETSPSFPERGLDIDLLVDYIRENKQKYAESRDHVRHVKDIRLPSEIRV